MHTDPIADLLTRIRNAAKARHKAVRMPSSKFKVSLLSVLKKGGFILDFKEESSGTARELVVELSPQHSQLSLKRISKPGQRIYIHSSDIKPVLNGYGIGVISTPQGVMTTSEARRKKLGGELLCEVW